MDEKELAVLSGGASGSDDREECGPVGDWSHQADQDDEGLKNDGRSCVGGSDGAAPTTAAAAAAAADVAAAIVAAAIVADVAAENGCKDAEVVCVWKHRSGRVDAGKHWVSSRVIHGQRLVE